MPECTHENEIQLLETQNNQLMREKAAVEQETLTYREEFIRLQQELDRERYSREQDAINHRFLSERELKSEETRRRTAETKAERFRLELEQLERSAALKTANILSVLHSRNARILQLEALLDEKNGDDARPRGARISLAEALVDDEIADRTARPRSSVSHSGILLIFHRVFFFIRVFL